eukprot:4823491-Pyramimonas_sp.AAC.1
MRASLHVLAGVADAPRWGAAALRAAMVCLQLRPWGFCCRRRPGALGQKAAGAGAQECIGRWWARCRTKQSKLELARGVSERAVAVATVARVVGGGGGCACARAR